MLYKVSYQATYLALWFCNRDTMIQQLQEQISDLSLYLEEERVNHRQTKQKVSPWVISELSLSWRDPRRLVYICFLLFWQFQMFQ